MIKQNGTVFCFLAITLGASSIFWALIIRSGHLNAAHGLYVSALMWCPGIAAIATVLIRRLKFGILALRWGGWRYALLSYLTPLAYATIAYALIWGFGLGAFPDAAALAAAAQKLGAPLISPSHFSYSLAFYLLLIGTGVVLPTLVTTLGEELGWRGLLTPAIVARLGFSRGSLLIGIIWAAWHMPILLFADYNTGTPWWFSIPCFCVLTIGISFILTWFRLASNSIWPCAILHASHNAFVQVFFTALTGPRGTVTPYVIDEFGVALPLVAAVFAIVFWLRRDRVLKPIPSEISTPMAPAAI
jgi:membrane protease YdiL (CAAX protease family)